MKKPNLKEIRLKFLSLSVIVSLFSLILLQGIEYLHFQRILCIPQLYLNLMSSASLVIATLFFISLLLRLTIKRIFYLFEEAEERIFYSKIYSWSIYSIGAFVILYHFGVSLGNITLFIGLIATGLAFAIRDVLMSFFGWIILLRKKPFRIGDYIKIGDDEGKVLHVGTFYVLLDSPHHFPENYTRVPNRLFLEKSIKKLGRNFYHEIITFRLSSHPANEDKNITNLISEIAKLTNKEERINVYVDIREEMLMLVIDYLVTFENRQPIKSKVIEITFRLYRDYIIIPTK